MTTQQSTFNINLEKLDQETILRLGNAPDLKQPQSYKFTGEIDSVSNYLLQRTKKLVSEEKAVIEVDINSTTISLDTSVNEEVSDTITGKMTECHLIDEFGINRNEKFSAKGLLEIIRKHSNYVVGGYKQYRDKLTNYNFKAAVEYSQRDDRKGNALVSLESKLDHDAFGNLDLVLNIPVFEGEVPIQFSIEVEIDIRNNMPELSLWSEELKEKKKKQAEERFASEIAKIKECGNYLIINKSSVLTTI